MDYSEIKIDTIKLAGLDLGHTTTNKNNQSMNDCGILWKRFEDGGYADSIPGKSANQVIAVYYAYEGDHTSPFRYFIGCPVKDNSSLPGDLDALTIPANSYKKITAKGPLPDCISQTWREIWEADMDRGYSFDFEIYDERSNHWNDAEIDIYLS